MATASRNASISRVGWTANTSGVDANCMLSSQVDNFDEIK